jgi:ubiquinone/menaquinone biosynthesis C-methylase UbiE
MTGRRRVRRGTSGTERSQWAATYEERRYDELPWFNPGPSPSVRDAVAEEFLTPKGRLLELGCGAGSNAIWLAQQGFRVTGIDLAPAAVEAAGERATAEGVSIEFRTGDALALDWPAASFDAAMDHGCFHTLPRRRRPEYAREVRRVLRPGGRYLLTSVAREYTAPIGPRHRLSIREIAEVFEPGFQILRTGYRPGGPDEGLPAYYAWMERREGRQPPPR